MRLAEPCERFEWDRLMAERHCFGFNQFACRGLRYVAQRRGPWLVLISWQTEAVQYAPWCQWLW